MKNSNQFNALFKKAGGTGLIKQYLKSNILFHVLIQVLTQGFDKKSLEIVRHSANNKIYKRLKKNSLVMVDKFLKDYPSNNLTHHHPDVVWFCWMQGLENSPMVVRKCYESLKGNLNNKEIIVVTEDNYCNYVTFPEYIISKYNKGLINRTQFSDLLRIELLANHGGTWIDSTVFCTSPVGKEYMLNSDLFLFQTLKPGLDGQCACISSWFMTASSNQRIILLTRELLLDYWKKNDYAIDYFLLHDFFQIAIETFPEDWESVIPFSNEMPHILLLRLFDKYDETIWNAVKDITPFHKLTYKFDNNMTTIDDTYYKRIVDC